MDTITIAIVDDEFLLVTLMKSFLEQTPHLKVHFTADEGELFLEHLKTNKAEKTDLLLLDHRMKTTDGIELMKQVKLLEPSVKVLVLSSYYQDHSIGFMIKEGVSAYLPKDISPTQLLEVIEQIHSNGFYFTRSQIEVLREQISSKVPEPVDDISNEIVLSERETEILKLICYQKTAKEIGEQLFIAQRTVEGHKNNLLSKLGVKNMVGLIVYALQYKIVSLEELSGS